MNSVTLLARPAAGGIRTHVIELAARLDRARWEINLAAPAELLASLPADLPPYRAVPCPIAGKPSLADFAAAAIVRRLAQESPKGLVHAHGVRAAFVAALAGGGRKFPLVATLHNVPPVSFLASFTLRFIRSRASALITVSRAIGERVGGNAVVIPNGIELAAYRGMDRASARALFGLDADTITVATASRLSPEKGLDFLLEAARLAPEVLFLIAGDGPQREPVAQHSPANVRLLGRIESVPELLAAADIACVPSLTEGQGIFALEAMAASLPVVASNVGGLPEMIDDAVTGFLVAPASPAAIVEAIRRLADSPQLRTVLGANASRHAEKIGDIYGMVRKVEDVYATVLASWR